jgi:hypothetical protein
MQEVEVARSEWADYFAALSALAAGARTTVEVLPCASAAHGVAPDWVLQGCRYDSAEDLLELTLLAAGTMNPALRCFVSAPREVIARESQLERPILVRDAAGAQTLVRLRRAPTRRFGPPTGRLRSSDTSRPAGSRLRLLAQARVDRSTVGGGARWS